MGQDMGKFLSKYKSFFGLIHVNIWKHVFYCRASQTGDAARATYRVWALVLSKLVVAENSGGTQNDHHGRVVMEWETAMEIGTAKTHIWDIVGISWRPVKFHRVSSENF